MTLKWHDAETAAFSPDGKTIVTGNVDNTLRVWNAASGKLSMTLKGHTGIVTSVAFSPNGKTIVSGSQDKTGKVWDAASGHETLTLKGHTHWVTSVAFSTDGKKIVSGSGDNTLKLWDASLSMDPRPRKAALEAGREKVKGKEE